MIKDKPLSEALNEIRDKKGRFTQAPPYGFKKGQVANPKGRPKDILTKKERLLLLSEMAKLNKHKANPVEAIREQNRMEGVYAEVQPGFQDNRTINIIVSSEKAKELTEGVSKFGIFNRGRDAERTSQNELSKETSEGIQGEA